MKTHLLKLAPTLAACALIAACSSTGPKPDLPSGEVRKANTQPETLAELIDITRAGMPRRFRADRDADLQEVLQAWTKTAGMTLHWKTSQRLSTSGGIDEIEIRAALMSLAAQFRSDQAALTLEFLSPKILQVTDIKTNELGCATVPAGAIALGRFCIAASPSTAGLHPTDRAGNETPQIPPVNANAQAQIPALLGSDSTTMSPATVAASTAQAGSEPPKNPLASHLRIETGQRLSVALQAWLAAQGVSLVWDVSAGGERLRDIEMIAEWRSPTPDIEKTLSQLLPAFGLRAIVQDNPRAVIVRSASGSALKTTGAAK